MPSKFKKKLISQWTFNNLRNINNTDTTISLSFIILKKIAWLQLKKFNNIETQKDKKKMAKMYGKYFDAIYVIFKVWHLNRLFFILVSKMCRYTINKLLFCFKTLKKY